MAMKQSSFGGFSMHYRAFMPEAMNYEVQSTNQ